jgi:hypothetical protein
MYINDHGSKQIIGPCLASRLCRMLTVRFFITNAPWYNRFLYDRPKHRERLALEISKIGHYILPRTFHDLLSAWYTFQNKQ